MAQKKRSDKCSSMGLRKVARAEFPTRYGDFTIYGFASRSGDEEAIALVAGKIDRRSTPLVRIHSQCLTGDVFGSTRCDCGQQLHRAMRMISKEGCGVLVYHLQEGRGIGLMNKLLAYELQDKGADTVEANRELGFAPDERDYKVCALILRHLGIKAVRLLSNNPHKVAELERYGIKVIERVPLEVPPSALTRSYLKAKKEKLGHLLSNV